MKINISHQQPEAPDYTTVARWQRHLTRRQKLIARLGSVSKRIEITRVLVVVLLVLFLALLTEESPYLSTLGKWAIIVGLAGAFAYLIYAYRSISRRKEFLTYLANYYQCAIHRRKREWGNLSAPEHESESHSASDVFSDLAVTGEQASLDKLFSMMHCADAWKKWTYWLRQTAPEKTINNRQEALKELMGKRPLLLRFLHASSLHKTKSSVRHSLINWLKSDDTHEPIRLYFIVSICLVILFWGVIVGILLKLIPTWSFFVVCGLNGLMTFLTLAKTDQLFAKAEGLKPVIQGMKSKIDAIQPYSFDSQYLKDLQAPLTTANNPAVKSLLSIQRLSVLAELRYSGVVYMFLQLTLLWNVPVYTGLSRWHTKHRQHILNSYESLTELEVLCGTACFALENREFAFPRQDDLSQTINFDALAHPLLSYEQRIANNLAWSDERPMLLVSGSNMAGKSTFMKAIGLNILLSRLGAPVCSEAALFPMINIKSVINVRDSLADGDSYFMVELKRLIAITQGHDNDEQGQIAYTLCLFDEIMSGTNSHDRTEIFKAIVAVLKQQNTFAIFSTHDMKLTDYAQGDSKFSLYEFSEQYTQESGEFAMHFDYKLKEGVCHQTNAQMLLKILGLDTAEVLKRQNDRF